jgi:hypothetical protein
MRKSLQFALAAGSLSILASAAVAQDTGIGPGPLFPVQPQSAPESPAYTVLPSTIWRTPVFPHTWSVPAVVPFTWEEPSTPDRAAKP